jgi:transmembrane sensor
MSDSGGDDKGGGKKIVFLNEERARRRKDSPQNGTEATGSDRQWKDAGALAQSRQPVPPSSTGRRVLRLALIVAPLLFFPSKRMLRLALIFAPLLFYPSKRIHAPSPFLYATDPMHRQTVLLPDGSRIDLDVGSSVELRLGPTGPVVRVLQGETMLHIRHDSRRHWVVWAGPNRIDDLGTDFMVHRGTADTRITVFDGRVEVQAPTISPTSKTCGSDLELAARGEVQIHETPAGAVVHCEVLTPQQLSERQGWRSGQVSFANESLQELAEDMGRYNGVTFNASDPAIAGLRVGGVLRRTNLAQFLEAIKVQYGIQAVSTVNRLGECVITLTPARGRGNTGGRHQ